MSTEIANVEDTTLDRLPPAHAPSSAARQMLLAHAEMMHTAWELANKMVNTQLVPTRFFRKPEDATAAILYGSELGLNPIQALQRIIPIHGMPTLEARTMVALLKSRGYKVIVPWRDGGWIRGGPDDVPMQSNETVTVWGRDLDGQEYASTWTIDRAVQAGYVPTINEHTGKYHTNARGNLIGNEKYLTDPQAMLKAKGQAEVCRDMAPEILLGISYTVEEMESERDFHDAPPSAPASAAEPLTVEEILGDTAAPAAESPGVVEQSDPAGSRQTVNQSSGSAARQDHDPNSDAASPDLRDPAPTPAPAAASPTAPEPAAPMMPGGPDPDADPEAAASEDPPEPPASPAQNKKLNTLFQDLGLSKAQREDRLIIVTHILGYTLEDPSGMTSGEALKVTEKLLDWMADDKTPVANRVLDILNAATVREAELAEAAAAAAALGGDEAPGQESLL